MNAPELILAGGQVVTPEGVLDQGWVRISGGKIAEVGTGPTAAGEVVDLRGQWLVPGFVDIHCHGGGGGSFTSIEVDQARAAIAAHRLHGTTTMLASLVSAPLPDLTKQISALSDLVVDGELAGIHLEGPFLSSARCGAHDPAILRAPEASAVQQVLDAGRGTVRMVTLAPELPNGVEAVRQLVDHGVIAAVGHTDAVLSQVVPAVEAGATVATHLFNAMRPLHHREPGPIGVLLEDERVTVELICDLVHLHPAIVQLAASHAGTGRTVLVTDAISATDAGDGTYELGKLPVTVANGEARLADGSLAGSTLTMDVAFRNLVESGGQSVPAAVAASSTKPAQLLGLDDRIGSIRPGLAADLAVLDTDLRLTGVLKDGAWAVDPR
ncbi:N-acetylglucosamine-6-phosphate deacetylase [Saccharopolyspora antimicrobica]|uniref:N-acetylglucosamine-6-phosphate deacetylase n=1 Tax=Saccharopolyspora antimicrobica TaxID=455193 RepID=A0A1I5JL79_9PSEU|nr:N-acetylglucosamine-6-phosphate deacetylase [Saccharopolyspora antimicrobica]RKT84662.1 N-acetylglucosamine-6-phosphate deacetylase [Saccharopolyspora antimicrobica]SFO73495.1 N-acetylglucosamine-6-phosphate deacetylase [Saccharopolyspora antimicrobica]